MTSKLSDVEVAALLREMGQDIGPINDATRGVYRRKLERLLLEQSILCPASGSFSPPEEPRRTETKQGLKVAEYTPSGMEDDFEEDEIAEGSLRLEDDELEDDFMDEHQFGGREPDRSEFGVNRARSDTNSVHKRKNCDSSDSYAVGRNPFAPEMTNSVLPSTFEAQSEKTVRATLHVNKGSRKETSTGDRFKLSGSFSSAPFATPNAPRNRRAADAEINEVRQRTAVQREREATNDVGTYDRAPLRPEDYVPSPRDPLSTYLERCTPPPSAGPPSARPTDQPVRVATTKPSETHGMWSWIAVAVVIICIIALLALYNMEPGYTSPV